MKFEVEFSPESEKHIKALPEYHQRKVIDSIEKQLIFEPDIETKNKKPMRPNPLASWELRIGNLRVYYDIEEKSIRKVNIIAIGKKERDIIDIGGEIIKI